MLLKLKVMQRQRCRGRIRRRLCLWKQIQLCGSETIQDHEQYKRLFGETPNVVSSLDLKILSTRLETAVWDSSSAPAWLRQ